MKARKGSTERFLQENINIDQPECLLWPYGRDGQGYGRAFVNGFTSRLAHRVMCEMAHGPAPFAGAVARHLCGRGHLGCINPKHLAWGSEADNHSDQIAHGTKSLGEQTSKAVLTEAKVREIRSRYQEGHSQRAIAADFAVHHTTIQAVIERRTWGHVQ